VVVDSEVTERRSLQDLRVVAIVISNIAMSNIVLAKRGLKDAQILNISIDALAE
jgi:hypothetical protein